MEPTVASGSWSVRRATSRPLAPLGVTTTSCHSERSEESALDAEATAGSTTSRRKRRGMDPPGIHRCHPVATTAASGWSQCLANLLQQGNLAERLEDYPD